LQKKSVLNSSSCLLFVTSVSPWFSSETWSSPGLHPRNPQHSKILQFFHPICSHQLSVACYSVFITSVWYNFDFNCAFMSL